jgi:hypothetical protein
MPLKVVTQVEIKWNLGLLSIVATASSGGAAGTGTQFRPVTAISDRDLATLCLEIANKIKAGPATLSLTVDAFNHLVPTPGIALLDVSDAVGLQSQPSKKNSGKNPPPKGKKGAATNKKSPTSRGRRKNSPGV